MRKIISCFLLVLLTQTTLLAQKRGQKTAPADGNLTEAELNLWDDGEYFYDQKNFMRALVAFEQLAKGHPKDSYFNYMTGICYLYKSDEKEMSFLDHLEELRWHIVRSIFAIMIFMILAFIFSKWIFQNIIFAPASIDFPTFKWLCQLGQLTGSEEQL